MEKAKQERFQLKIFSPYQTYYAGEAVSLSARNKTGPFDVLAGHASLFTLLSPGKVKVNTGYQIMTFSIASGLMKVNRNQVTLFAEV